MNQSNPALDDEATRLVADCQHRILAAFPEATFGVRVGPDGRVYLDVTSDARHDFEIHDLVAESGLDSLIAGTVKIHVFPRRRAR
jgi:hypothetical protein